MQGNAHPDYHLIKRLIIQIPLVLITTLVAGAAQTATPQENQIAAAPAEINIENEIELPEFTKVSPLHLAGAPSAEAAVRAYFKDTPVMIKIAKCESTYRHTDKSGNILRGRVDSDDIGVMQINLRYHGKTAQTLGIDLYTLEGNMEYAKHLYNQKGTQPWSASAPCWKK